MGNFINKVQTSQERRDKYKKVVKAGYPWWVAYRIRDWTQNHLKQFLEANDPKSYKEITEWQKNKKQGDEIMEQLISFLQAVEVMKQGKSVKRATWSDGSVWKIVNDNLIDSTGAILCDWEIIEEKKTLSEKLEVLKGFQLNPYQARRLQARIVRGENTFKLIMEKEREQVERCEGYFKEALKEFIVRFSKEVKEIPPPFCLLKEIFGEKLINKGGN